MIVTRSRPSLVALAAGHGSADMCQGAVPAMIPFLVSQRGMSLAATTMVLVAMTTASSVLQPLFGLLADRRVGAWVMPVALCCAGLGIAGAGAAHGNLALLLCLMVSGLGVAAFHPEAADRARAVAGRRHATAMSYFALGGNAGFAIAPAAVTPAILLLGLPGVAIVLGPTLVCAVLLAFQAPREGPETPAVRTPAALTPAARWGPFTRLATIAALRSGVYFGLQAFLAIHFIDHLNTSEAMGNTALTVMLVAGAAGTLAGGRLADRYDRRIVLAGFMIAVPPLLALFLVLDDPVPALVVIALIGFATIGNFSLTVVMGQEYLPGRPAFASGVTLGLAIGVGGLIAAALGPLADHVGVTAVLWLLAVLPLPAAALAAALPATSLRDAPTALS